MAQLMAVLAVEKHERAQLGISATLELQSGVLAGTETHVVPLPIPDTILEPPLPLPLDPNPDPDPDPEDPDPEPEPEEPEPVDEHVVPPIEGPFAQLHTALAAD